MIKTDKETFPKKSTLDAYTMPKRGKVGCLLDFILFHHLVRFGHHFRPIFVGGKNVLDVLLVVNLLGHSCPRSGSADSSSTP